MKPSAEEDRLLAIKKKMCELEGELAKLCVEVQNITHNNPRSPNFNSMAHSIFEHWNNYIDHIEYTVDTWGIPLIKS
jgi:hypothetical protein